MIFLKKFYPVALGVRPFEGPALYAYDLEEVDSAMQYLVGRSFENLLAIETEANRILGVLLPVLREDTPEAFAQCGPVSDPSEQPICMLSPVCTFKATAHGNPLKNELRLGRWKCLAHYDMGVKWAQQRTREVTCPSCKDPGLVGTCAGCGRVGEV